MYLSGSNRRAVGGRAGPSPGRPGTTGQVSPLLGPREDEGVGEREAGVGDDGTQQVKNLD